MSSRFTLLETDLRTSIARTRWLLTGYMMFGAALGVCIVYGSTVGSAVHLWLHHNTYGYAFAVLPIAAFIVWLRREHFRSSVPQPDFSAVPVVLLFASLWLTGQKQSVLEIQHIAVPGMLVGIIVSAIGWANAYRFALPLLYLFLLAPAGTPLLPYLQVITTWFATAFLQLGHIPFYAEGNFIEVATGKYEVAPGCAGLNFVLALATMAPLYCEIMYSKLAKKIVVLACMMMLVPVANGLRVFGIIAIAEYTNRAIDISADHLFYGWVFFSSIVLVLFWIGSFVSDPPPAPVPIMPWGGNYTRAELFADPIIVRVQWVLLFSVCISVMFPLLQAGGVL